MDLHCMILAGGKGTRFWPVSRLKKSKQPEPEHEHNKSNTVSTSAAAQSSAEALGRTITLNLSITFTNKTLHSNFHHTPNQNQHRPRRPRLTLFYVNVCA